MKPCARCKQTLPLSEFGVDRARADGLNSYCKLCICEKVFESRRRKREYIHAQEVHRKPCSIAEPIWRKRISPKAKVILAMESGEYTQRGIQRATRLYIDQITDILAALYDTNQLDRRSLRERKYRLAA